MHSALRLLLVATMSGTPLALAAEPQAKAEDLQEVVITATPLRKPALLTAQPVFSLGGESLVRQRSASLGDTLAMQPGLSASSFGPIASRPIIRGQGGLRVQTYQDGGDTLEAAALSDDHAVTLDPLLAERIEVLRPVRSMSSRPESHSSASSRRCVAPSRCARALPPRSAPWVATSLSVSASICYSMPTHIGNAARICTFQALPGRARRAPTPWLRVNPSI